MWPVVYQSFGAKTTRQDKPTRLAKDEVALVTVFSQEEIMAKRAKKKSTTKRKITSPKKKKGTSASALTPEQLESSLLNLFDFVTDNPEFSAQEHAFDAMEAMGEGDYDAAEAAAIKALDLNSNCIDALHILAQLGSKDEEDFVENLRLTVARAERALGKKYFRNNTGYFWGMLETRPYMRARADLAQALYQRGDRSEAIEHIEEMLQLNPNDNQGLRYLLLGWYLEAENVAGGQQLFDEYPEESSAVFAWGRLLLALLTKDLDMAPELLAEARECNRHVEPFLTGRKRLPKKRTGFYSPGDSSEAVMCMDEIGAAWKQVPHAIKWLKQQKP